MSAPDVERRRSPLIIGLLGGIGSGKSTVARILAELGAYVFNADQVANELLQDGEVARELTAVFGTGILAPEAGGHHADAAPAAPARAAPEGRVDRGRLAALVFGDADKLERLNAILHPRVTRELEKRLAEEAGRARPRPVVLDVPLLLESALRDVPQVLVFVEAPETVRRARVAENRGWPGDELQRRERHQLATEEKRRRAHHVVRNTGTLSELERAVGELWQTLQNALKNDG
jgi:dephospho-CoA kinase